MSEMVERVARAMCAETYGSCICRQTANIAADCQGKSRIARAAIEAMREPTDKMISELCCCSLSWDSRDRTYIHPADAKAAWQDAIDEALK